MSSAIDAVLHSIVTGKVKASPADVAKAKAALEARKSPGEVVKAEPKAEPEPEALPAPEPVAAIPAAELQDNVVNVSPPAIVDGVARSSFAIITHAGQSYLVAKMPRRRLGGDFVAGIGKAGRNIPLPDGGVMKLSMFKLTVPLSSKIEHVKTGVTGPVDLPVKPYVSVVLTDEMAAVSVPINLGDAPLRSTGTTRIRVKASGGTGVKINGEVVHIHALGHTSNKPATV